MIKAFFLVITTFCAICLFPGKSVAQSQSLNRFKKAERVLESMVRKRKVPGMAITVSKNQQVVWSKGVGFADIKKKIPISSEHTVFRIGSISKPIAAIALLRGVEKGLIALDSSIYKYVPYFPKKQYDITVKQLGTHTSGIRSYKGNEFKSNKPLSIKEGISFFQNSSLGFKPGTNFIYSSYNWNLISLAIIEQANVAFEDFVKTEVLLPFRMEQTFADKNQNLRGKAVFYQKKGRRRFKPVEKVNNYFKLASGGFLSTSQDINAFGNALLKMLSVSPNRLKEFTTAQKIKINKALTSTYYGVGFQVSNDSSGRPYFGHIGNALGGYGVFYVYPETNVVVSILANCSNPNSQKMYDKLINKIFEVL
ncbi:serine hydrolase domain-containing protein [Tamlana crocina]|uniref:Beta-lactamase family protein n=1 Tax=Tamlana crocina TaxID=393006 RepID=A0ABX1D951_9FLAO|nr:serine hydrolase domain-containing protein [Tamlana crocina]NJX14861.1 beta-lactamase family protein [Tamlana crocina]